MAIELLLLPEAERDIDEAYAWYELSRGGLGEEFLGCLDARFEKICLAPEFNERVHRDFRRALVRKFPYAIFYEFVGSQVTVFGVFHTSRDPMKWRQRIS